MSVQKYKVQLSKKQRKKLKALCRRGKISARKLNRGRILLMADSNRAKGGFTDAAIAQILDVGLATVVRVRRQFVTSGLDTTLEEAPRSGRPKKFTPTQRASVTALACSDPPEGHGQWSLRLMADKLVELDFVESITHTSVRNILKKTNFLLI